MRNLVAPGPKFCNAAQTVNRVHGGNSSTRGSQNYFHVNSKKFAASIHSMSTKSTKLRWVGVFRYRCGTRGPCRDINPSQYTYCPGLFFLPTNKSLFREPPSKSDPPQAHHFRHAQATFCFLPGLLFISALHDSFLFSATGLPCTMDHMKSPFPLVEHWPDRRAEDDEREVTLVAGRKAARLMNLFRGDGHNVDALIDPTDQEPAVSRKASLKKPETLLQSDSPSLEPVSSATYIPHHPVKLKEGPFNTLSPDNNLQHLTADVEFDRGSDGDITRIKKRTPERRPKRRTKVNFIGLDDKNGCNNLHDDFMAVNLNESASVSDHGDTNTLASTNEAYPLTVELRPFRNKVGGHTAIFRFSKRAVCKALMNRENVWYEAVEKRHPELLKFLPKYIGVLNVRYSSIVSEDANSPLLVPSESTREETPHARQSLDGSKPNPRSRLSEDGPPPEVSLDDNLHIIPDLLRKHYSSSAPSIGALDEMSCSIEGQPEVFPSTSPENNGYDASIGSTSVNQDLQAQIIQEVFVPPGTKSDDIFEMDHDDIGNEDHDSLNEHAERPEEERHVLRKHTRFERFILLEDLTAEMQRPCALDLKMGTRQYGLEATDAKQASQRKKCATTTSRELGVRVCGLQVWDRSKQKYFTRDKYFGRKLHSGLPFAKTLAKFLYDGMSAFSIICKIPHIIKQLEALIEIFSKLVGYRMYGLSVLLMYDGAGPEDTEVRANIIDFAQSVLGDETSIQSYRKPPMLSGKPDMGYLRGLKSIRRYLKVIFKIITGDDYDSITKHLEEYLKTNRDRLNEPYVWVEEFAESKESADSMDAFDIRYDDRADDDEYVSE